MGPTPPQLHSTLDFDLIQISNIDKTFLEDFQPEFLSIHHLSIVSPMIFSEKCFVSSKPTPRPSITAINTIDTICFNNNTDLTDLEVDIILVISEIGSHKDMGFMVCAGA